MPSSGRADDTGARAAALEAVVAVGCVEIDGGVIGHDADRVDRLVALVIVALDIIELIRRRHTRPLVEPALKPREAGLIGDELAGALPRVTRIAPALLDSGTFYAARAESGEVVGCGGWTLESPGGGAIKREVGHVRQFATHPNWMRVGVGCAIFGFCERDALRRDLRRLEVFASLNAEDFYKALNFTRKRRIAGRLGDGVFLPAVLMRKALA